MIIYSRDPPNPPGAEALGGISLGDGALGAIEGSSRLNTPPPEPPGIKEISARGTASAGPMPRPTGDPVESVNEEIQQEPTALHADNGE